jgi:uroporphyrin-III C-methyltransferase
MNIESNSLGKVILAAAGPGDPDLITVRALRYLQQADVVITDRLVSEELLSKNMKAGAELIYAGKQGGNHASARQEDINQLIVEQSKKHSLIVRLKGGDIAFFSNVLDELQTLVQHCIPFEIVPGVTAASGASAYAGIPLTARGYSTAVRFLAYTKSVIWDENYWSELASTDDTLVFYMSTELLGSLVQKLIDNNISSDKLLAVVEQATTPLQNTHIFNLSEYVEKLKEINFVTPNMIIIGRVVALHNEFKWIANNTATHNYFKPLSDTVK